MASMEKVEMFLAEPRNVVVAGIRSDGRPHLSPNWFSWDGQRFYVSTTRGRVKYAIFRRDPRAQLLIDDPAGFRAVLVPAIVEIREDLAAELPHFRAIREKHGMAVPDDDEHLRALAADGRVLLAITPDKPPSGWTSWGWTDHGIPRMLGAGAAVILSFLFSSPDIAQSESTTSRLYQTAGRSQPRWLWRPQPCP
jgi:PPOX class probable F420-dependent enzyme